MKIEHCPGKENQLADLLSRNRVEEVTEELDDQERYLPLTNDVAARSPEKEPDTAISVIESRTLVEEIRDTQQTDPNLTKEEQQIVDYYGVIAGIL